MSISSSNLARRDREVVYAVPIPPRTGFVLDEPERQKEELIARQSKAPTGAPDVHPKIASIYRKRVHRYFIHHVLAERGLNPPNSTSSVSAVILNRIEEYRHVFEYSFPTGRSR